jgi:hypothetical protein
MALQDAVELQPYSAAEMREFAAAWREMANLVEDVDSNDDDDNDDDVPVRFFNGAVPAKK